MLTRLAVLFLLVSAAGFGQYSPPVSALVLISSQYPASDFICALHADTVSGAPACNNQVTDGSTETAFTTTYTVPAATLSTGVTYRVKAIIRFFDGATATNIAVFSLYYDATKIATNFNNVVMPNTFSQTMESTWTVTSASASSTITGWTMNNSQSNANVNGTAQPVAVTSTNDASFSIRMQYSANTAGNGARLLALLVYRER